MKPKANRKGEGIYKPSGMDLCQTSPWAVLPLLGYLRQRLMELCNGDLSRATIWEPAAGEGYLSCALANGLHDATVIGTDLLVDCTIHSNVSWGRLHSSPTNFFDYEPPNWDILVTNPPYSIKYDWLERCYDLGKPFALLLPVETLGAARAQRLFRAHGLEVLFLPKRVKFKMPNIGWEKSSPQFPVAWFCHRLLPNTGNASIFADWRPEYGVDIPD